MGDTMTRPGDCTGLGGYCISARSLSVLSTAGGVWYVLLPVPDKLAVGDTTIPTATPHVPQSGTLVQRSFPCSHPSSRLQTVLGGEGGGGAQARV